MRTIPALVSLKKQAILDAFEARARRTASARGLNAPALASFVPDWLELVSGEVRLRRQLGRSSAWSASEAHERLHLGEAILEVGHLRRAVADVARDLDRGSRPSRAEWERFSWRLDALAAEVSERYQREREDASQRAAHFVEALETAAGVVASAAELALGALTRALERLLACLVVGRSGLSLATRLRTRDGAVAIDAASDAEAYEVMSRLGSEEARTAKESAAVPDGAIALDIGGGGPFEATLFLASRRSVGPSADLVANVEIAGRRMVARLDDAWRARELRRRVDALRAEHESRLREAAAIAHDLRGPLTTAKLGSELLLRDATASSHAEILLRIARSLARMDGMLRDFLDVSVHESGQTPKLRFSECELVALAREVVADLAATHGRRIVLSAPEQLTGFWSEGVLRRALWNLTVNALRHGAEDEPVEVLVAPEREEVRLGVHNASRRRGRREPSGPASAEMLEGGWGLGLTVVRACAEGHGGRIEVHASESSGTSYALVLPRDARARAPAPTA